MRLPFLIALILLGMGAAQVWAQTPAKNQNRVPAKSVYPPDIQLYSFMGGRIDGLKVLKAPAGRSPWAKIGVQKDDIILGWNYQKIRNSQAAWQAYRTKDLRMAAVLRDGRKVILKRNE